PGLPSSGRDRPAISLGPLLHSPLNPPSVTHMKLPSVLRILIWTLVVALGAGSLGVLAWARGEHVSALWVVVASVCVFAVAYRFHSAWLMAKVLTLDELRAPPSVVKEDGKDFV